MADSVLYEVTDGLATITINRPDAMNAMNTEAKVALRDAVVAAAGDTAVRAVLLTAAGNRAFCVGQDLKEHIGNLAADRESGSSLTMNTVKEHYNPIVRALTEMPKPVVAGVNGVAAGAASVSRWRPTSGSSPTPPPSTPRSPVWPSPPTPGSPGRCPA